MMNKISDPLLIRKCDAVYLICTDPPLVPEKCKGFNEKI